MGAGGGVAASAPGAPSSVSATITPNAIVLPDPVCDETSRSRPATAGSRTAAWTPVAVSYLRAASALASAGRRLSSEKFMRREVYRTSAPNERTI